MIKNQKIYSLFFLSTFLLIIGYGSLAADPGAVLGEGRYFVSSKSLFVQKLFGAHHDFGGGFTTDLTKGEIWTLEKIFRISVQEVPLYNINQQKQPVDPEIGQAATQPRLPNDSTGWGLEMVYQDSELAKSSGGEDVVVAILDTGIETRHKDLSNRLAGCVDFTRSTVITNTCEDRNGHGTHVAGVIAADGGKDGKGVWGVAPESKILSYKVCRNDGSCWADDVAIAIAYAVSSGADIIVIPLGGKTESNLLKSSIAEAAKKNVLLVASAGDTNVSDKLFYPASYPEVVAVGAIDSDKNVSAFSPKGSNDKDGAVEFGEIEFVFPGVNIESTWSDGFYKNLSGTSVATAFAGGLAAKIWDGKAQTTRGALKEAVVDIGKEGEDQWAGFGFPVLQK